MRSTIFSFALLLVLSGLFLAQPNFFSKIYAQNIPAFIFLRDLRLGDSGADVVELHKILNSDAETQISDPSSDSGYFSEATADGVVRFQNKYADEVLRPAGLTQGSGFVGLWTRLKLNQILLNASVGQTPTPPPSMFETETAVTNLNLGLSLEGGVATQNNSAELKDLMLAFPSTNSGIPGSNLTISGSGFSLVSNTIYFSKDKKVIHKLEKVVPKNSKEISFVIPNIPVGRYDISISNGTKKDSGTVPFVVTAVGALPPVVESISPAQTNFGKKITITGQNFTPTGNIVTSNVGVIKDIKSADGKTMTFVLPPPEYLDDEGKLEKFWLNSEVELEWPVVIRVVNVNGVSADSAAAKFEIKI